MVSRNDKLKAQAAKAYLVSVLVFWGIQISVGVATVPLYFLVAPFVLLIIGISSKDIKFLISVSCVTYLFSLAQLLQEINIISRPRSYSAVVVFPILILAIAKALQTVVKIGQPAITDVLKLSIYTVLAWQLMQYIQWAIFSLDVRYAHPFLPIPRLAGPFLEPSHVAVGLSPALFLFVNALFEKSRFSGRLPFIALLLIFILAPSATFVAVLFLALISQYVPALSRQSKGLFKKTFTIFALGGLSFLLLMQWDYFAQRLTGAVTLFLGYDEATNESNISVLALLKGYQMAMFSIKEYPLGVGLLNMQFLAPMVEVSYINELLFGLNSYDGASLLFKTVAEFGYVGVIFVTIVCLLFIRAVRTGDLWRSAFIFGFLAASIRGTSYFDGAPIIAVTIVMLYLFGQSLGSTERKVEF